MPRGRAVHVPRDGSSCRVCVHGTWTTLTLHGPIDGEKSYGASLLRCFSFSVCVRLFCVGKTPFNINYKMF